jgi:uncharacterized protein
MSIYTHSVKSVTKSVVSLKNILSKIPDFIEKNKGQWGNYTISEEYVLSCRIAPNMFPLTRQVQIVSDNLKAMVSKITGVEAPQMEDNETTVTQLIERLEKTLEFVGSISQDKYEGAENRQARLRYMPGKYFEMEDFVVDYAIPNIYFHIVTAYNILRQLGVEVGKNDYIGIDLNLKDDN